MNKTFKSSVTIKGTKEAILFILNDFLPWATILQDLKYKLDHHKSSHMWDGPDMNVKFKIGERILTPKEEEDIKLLFASRPNMKILDFESNDVCQDVPEKALSQSHPSINIMTGTVRSGQVIEYTGDLLLIGDINPGGVVRSTGSIYVVGSVRGVAHAGSEGNDKAIIAASFLQPTQIRIVNIIAGALLHMQDTDCTMCFAYLSDDQVILDKLINLSKVRPALERRLV